MYNYAKILEMSKALHEVVDARDPRAMVDTLEALEQACQDEFGEKMESFEAFYAYIQMMYAETRYLAYNNFYEYAQNNCKEVRERYESCCKYSGFSKQQLNEIGETVKKMDEIGRSLPIKHKNLTIPRHDTLCCLCREKPANNTGAHMVPNFLTHPTFSFDGRGKRSREALDHSFLNELERFCSYYGSEVPPERMELALGHKITDEDIEDNTNQLEYDNEFCTDCEKRFGLLEMAYSAYYTRQNKKISPRVSYLFWMSVIWRMAIGRMSIFMDVEDELPLRRMLNDNILDSLKAIETSKSDLGTWKYAIFRAEGLKEGDKGIFGYRKERAPYVVMYNDLVMVFYSHDPADEELTLGPISIDRAYLNDWHEQEKEQLVDRRWFWNVRDWLVETSYDYYDPAREQALLLIREEERHSDAPLSQEGKDFLIKARRLAVKPKQKMLRLRKLQRVACADFRRKEAEKKGEKYDPLADEELFLTERDFQQYYEDLAKFAQYAGLKDVKQFPFYAEARLAIPDKAKWRASATEELADPEYAETMDWFLRQLKPEKIEQLLNVAPGFIKVEKIRRNDPCPCGSGRKFKNCCGKSNL